MKFLFLLILVSCQNSEGTKIFAEFDKEHKAAELECRKYEEDFLKKSFSDNGPDNYPYHFVKEEKKALEAIDGYKLDYLDHTRSLNFQNLAYKHCEYDGKSGDIHYYCPDSITHHQFFNALVSSIQNENWSEATKKKGMELTRKYLQKENGQPGSLVARAFMLNLLKMLDKKNLSEIEKVISDLDVDIQKRRKDFTPNMDCKKMSASFDNEMISSEKYRPRIQKIIDSI